MRPFEDDLPFLTKYQQNWVKRLYSSWYFRKFEKTVSRQKRKELLDGYLTGLVDLLKDSRNEINFLRRFVDRDGIYTVQGSIESSTSL